MSRPTVAPLGAAERAVWAEDAAAMAADPNAPPAARALAGALLRVLALLDQPAEERTDDDA